MEIANDAKIKFSLIKRTRDELMSSGMQQKNCARETKAEANKRQQWNLADLLAYLRALI